MDGTFTAILEGQEREDRAAAACERKIAAAVRREFSNGEEMLAAARGLGLSGRDFFASEGLEHFPLLPVRTADAFSVKKHTTSQRPYLHGQDFYELICVHGGTCAQTFGDGSALRLCAGQSCLLPPGAVHRLGRSGKGDVVLKLIIPPALFERTGGAVLARMRDRAAECAAADAKCGIRLFDTMTAGAQYLLFRLLEEGRRKDTLSELCVPACLTLLFSELARGELRTDAEAEELLRAYFEEDVRGASLAGFARRLHYSANYAGRMIRARTGKSFSEHAALFRLRAGANLLAQTDLPIEEVAERAGYADASGFYKRFCAAYGMTPGEYRKLFKRG